MLYFSALLSYLGLTFRLTAVIPSLILTLFFLFLFFSLLVTEGKCSILSIPELKEGFGASFALAVHLLSLLPCSEVREVGPRKQLSFS